jgi:hypothetical protein
VLRGSGLGLALAALLAPASVAAMECATAADEAALRARVLQTELMVAALSCERRESYNDFVVRYRPALVREGETFKRYFRRVHGSGAETEINSFVTRLANLASQRSIDDRPAFCSDAITAFEQLAALGPDDFATFLEHRPQADLPGIALCAASTTTPSTATP